MHEKRKLAIVHTHPVQYNAPLYQLLTERGNIEIKVFYTWSQWKENKLDKAFGRVVEWDVPLLEGYAYSFVENKAAKPGLHFMGINNPALFAEIKEWGSDAVLVYGWNYRSHLALMRQAAECMPVYFRGDSHLLNQESFLKKTIKKVFLNWVYKPVHLAFYVGSHNKRYYKAFGLKEENLTFAPHAVNNLHFHKPSPYLAELRKKISYKENETVLLFVGKLEPVKDPFTLLKAFLALNEKANVKLVFIGEGPLKEELQELAKGIANIYFLGFQNQSQMPSVYGLGDVLLLPSISETWGLAVNEAMAAGKAVIASDKVGCAADLILEGVNGYTFAAGNYKTLAAVLQKLIVDRARVKSMGKASFKIISKWTFDEIAVSLEKSLKSLKSLKK